MSLNYLVPFALYVAVASPATYKLTRGVAGSWIASAEGLATVPGLLLHALVFVLVAGYLMRLLNPRASGYGHMMGNSSYYGDMMGRSEGYVNSRKASALPDLMGSTFPAKI